MSVTYCNGGATGGIEKCVDHGGVVWYDARASAVAARIKKAGWSTLPWIASRWPTCVESAPFLHAGGISDLAARTSH